MSYVRKTISNFLRDKSANISMLMGLLAIPMFLGVGVAVDTINAVKSRTQLQAAADAAALAGATNTSLSDTQLAEIVRKYAAENGMNRALWEVLVVDGKYDETRGVFRSDISGKMKTSLMSLAGFSEIKIAVSSEVSQGSRAMDVAMVLDTTGSMANPISKMQALQSAANKFIDVVHAEKAAYSDIRIGLVPFAEYVNVGSGAAGFTESNALLALLGEETGCVGSRSAANRTTVYGTNERYKIVGDACTSEVLPLTSDMTLVRSRIASLPTAGNTFIPAGVLWGWHMLTPAAPYTEAMTDAALAEKQGHRIMILMTDGQNTISPGALGGKHDETDVALSNEMTRDLCTNAKADKIGIYTISFMVTDPTIQSILDNCATVVGNSYNADNAAQLTAAFTEIGTKLANMHLSQ